MASEGWTVDDPNARLAVEVIAMSERDSSYEGAEYGDTGGQESGEGSGAGGQPAGAGDPSNDAGAGNRGDTGSDADSGDGDE